MSPESFERGSEWRRWDLHVHSPLSILNNQYPTKDGEPDWDAFLNELEAQDLAVLGITDYFTIAGYRKLRQFKADGRLPNIHTILPNIEFRLNNIVRDRDGTEKRLNLHVIFSDEVAVEDIEEHFLHDLHFYYQGNPQGQDESRKLKVSNLMALGERLMDEHESFRKRGSPLQVGAEHAVVDHAEIREALGDSRFKGKYLVVLAADGWDRINWDTQAHMVRKGLLQGADMVFASNPRQREWCLGKPPYTEGEERFRAEFTTLKPCIHGCDAHRLEEIGRPCARRGDATHKCEEDPDGCDMRFCWIKADPTFEGLKQLLYEPEDRVTIGPVNPSPVISNLSLDRVSIGGAIVNDELSVADTEISLNPSLVAVVGGKGTGKTALVDLIAHCYMDREEADDPNSFVRRVSADRPPLTMELGFRDGERFAKALRDGQFFDPAHIVYIAQGELERYIGAKSDLHQRIQDLIFESDEIKGSVLSFDSTAAEATTESLANKLSVANETVEEFETATSSKLFQELEKERAKLKIDLEDVEKRLKELAKTKSKAAREKAEARQERLEDLKVRQKNLGDLKEVLEGMQEFLENELGGFNESVATADELMKDLKIEGKLPKLIYPEAAAVTTVLEFVGTDGRKVIEEIDREQKEQAKMDREAKAHAKLLEKRGELQAAQSEVEKKAKVLEQKKRKLKDAVKERRRLFTELLASVVDQKTKYREIIEAFAQQKDEILADIDFVAEIRFDVESLLDRAEGVLDNRKVVVRGDGKTTPEFGTFIELAQELASGVAAKVDELADEAERLEERFRNKMKASPVTVGDLYGLLYRNYMEVVPVVKYKKTTLENLSLGQKATVLIKIYLAHGDKPIIIDSHDDHLDNEFIMDELVRAVRRAKASRQVILVSNNGNAVINSDAEQIVIAHRSNGEISYTAGSIENPEIRETALRVLEGGRIAFKKRQEKYRVSA